MTKAARRRTKTLAPVAEFAVRYDLAELPSSQHRAGLAGLVLMIRWLERLPSAEPAVCRVEAIDAYGAEFRFDRRGLERLFDEVYGASAEEVASKTPRKDRKKNLVPPLREEERSVVDPKTGQTRTQRFYIYPAVVPRGAFLRDLQPEGSSEDGPWIKLWRSVVWSILRGIPAQRAPYETRAAGEPSGEAAEAVEALVAAPEASVDLPSTYFLGAQARTADNVPFQDRARSQFLLHFWPFVAAIYVPMVVDREGKADPRGYALALPDVADLEGFCADFDTVLRQRSPERRGYLPRGACIDVLAEAALDLCGLIASAISEREGRQSFADLLAGIDVVHVEKDGNNVRIRGQTRILPRPEMVERFDDLRRRYRSRVFRAQRVLNLVHGRPWHDGMVRVACTTPEEQTIGSAAFRHDAREAFEYEEHMQNGSTTEPIERLVYRVAGGYVARRVEGKYQLRWDDVRTAGGERREKYNAAREKVSREAFLAARSRSGADFVEFFTSTLCSVPQFLREDEYLALTRALLADTETVRTLTLLALSAHSWTSNPKTSEATDAN